MPIKKWFLIIISISFIVLFSGVRIENVRAESQPPDFFQIPGRLKGTGTYFELTDSEYLNIKNIKVESSEPAKLTLESVPEMVILYFEPISDASPATITIGGFLPLITYHKYEDDYHNHIVFTTDEEGEYTYIQNLSQPHFVFIQPRPSTKFIRDDSTGGDCYLIGNWDINTKTCTLTQDLNETIQIDNDNITLDGNGYTLIGSKTAYGVYIYNKTNITVENLSIKNFTVGIGSINSQNNIITDNTISNNSYGIYFSSSGSHLVVKNIVSNNRLGIFLWSNSMFNTLKSNDISNNGQGITLYGSRSNTVIDNTILNNHTGLVINTTNSNMIYNNNFIDSMIQTYVYRGDYNYFSGPLPSGGNYWSDFDTPEEGCYNLNNDNFCDSPYLIYNWGGFGYLQDTFPWIIKDGWLGPQNQAPSISNLGQFKSDGIVSIFEGGITTESSEADPRKSIIVFKATPSDPDNDQVKLQVELKEYDQPFNEEDLLESDFVNSGSEALITKSGLVNGQYHWRARAVDDKGGVSNWQEFGIAGNVDFEVKLVPLYTQVISPYPSEVLTAQWANLDYAEAPFKKYKCGSKIKHCGCAITSIVMIARYYDVVETQGTDVNPKEINNWLKNEPGGYKNGDVNWVAAAKYTSARIKYEKADKTTNNYALLDEYLNKNQPVISKEARGRGGLPHDHFIVIDNKLATTYGVKDPAWYNTKKLNEITNSANKIRGYENGFDGLRIYKKGDGIAQSAIVIALGSPAELLITNPQGRKLGKDQHNIEYNEIPDALYFEDGFDDPTGEEPPSEERNKLIYILEPLGGKYKLEVIGTGEGQYSLYPSFYDTQGNPLAKEFHSEITSGQIAQYKIFFDPSNSNNTKVELVDELPPEAEIYFDQINKKLVIVGIDNITIHPVVSCLESGKETICQIQDEAGNITKLIFNKFKHEGKEIKAELKSIQYNNQPAIKFSKTELKYEWSIDKKTGDIKNLEQRITVKNQFDIKAKYNYQKDETEIKINTQETEQKQTFPGIIIIRLTTELGNLGFRF